MKAMIFAAGLGSRLGYLTHNMPKALVEIGGKTLLEHCIIKLKSFGIVDIIINVHHFGAQIIDYLNAHNNFEANIFISNEEDELLDTGGGLFKAKWFFNDGKPFLVHNVDIFSEINIDDLYNYHIKMNGVATLAVKSRTTARYFLFNEANKLVGWANNSKNEVKLVNESTKSYFSLAFSGIQIVDPIVFNETQVSNKFSITQFYLKIANKYNVFAYNHGDTKWMDLGKPENLIEAEKLFNL